MNRLKATILFLAFSAAFTACKKNNDTIIVVPASDGAKLQLNGLVGSETGSNAGNSVYVDLSTDKATAVQRASWDLGLYTGPDFRVILNNTTSATGKATSQTDITKVGIADTLGLNKLAIGYDAASFALIDDVAGDLSKTLIAAVSATDADNKVYIINRGTGGGIAARDWYKIRILRSGTGYKLQYAKLDAATFSTIDVVKSAGYDFQYVSFDNGPVKVSPEKTQWDFVWSYTIFQTPYMSGYIPYASSDFITVNFRNGVQVAEVLTSAGGSYDDFKESNIASLTFTAGVDALGTKWRTASATAGQSGVKTDRFYVLKDPSGNIYKIKFLSFHADDGGTRGKPEFEYKLVKKG
jgi:hypothetical protein